MSVRSAFLITPRFLYVGACGIEITFPTEHVHIYEEFQHIVMGKLLQCRGPGS